MSKIDVDSINDLAQHIRQVNGNNDMGSVKLSESILEWQATRAQTASNEHGKNRYGLDMAYFRDLFNRELNRPLTDFRPDELARVLVRAARAADETVLQEPEFQSALAQAVQGGGVPEIVATFECESNGITGSTTAPTKRIELHDDGTIEVILDYWPTSPHTGEQGGEWVRCDERLPTEADTDCYGTIIGWDSIHDQAVTMYPMAVKHRKGITHWKPTGLTRPQPPKSKECK